MNDQPRLLTIQDFENLREGDVRTLFTLDPSKPQLNWVHHKVVGDLIFGELNTGSGKGPYSGPALYKEDESMVMVSHITGERLDSRIVYNRPPLPSQSGRFKNLFDEPINFKPVALSTKEQAVIKEHFESLKDRGLYVSDYFGKDIFRDAVNGGVHIEAFTGRERQRAFEEIFFSLSINKFKNKGFFGSTFWNVGLSDKSYRRDPSYRNRIDPGETTLLVQRGITSFEEAIQILQKGIDTIFLKYAHHLTGSGTLFD